MPFTRLIPSLLCLALLSAVHAGDAEDIANSLNRGRADDALQAADKALAKSPKDARLRLLRGNALAQLGRTAEAIQTYTALTSEYPNLPEPYNNLAAIYAQQGQLDKARAALQMALQTNPAYATAHANLADVYARLAAQAYDKALQRDVVERQARPQDAPPTQPVPKLVLVPDLLSRVPPAAGKPVVVAQAPSPAPVTQPASIAPTPAPTKPLVVAAAPSPTPTPVQASKPVTPPPAAAAKPSPSPTPTPTPATTADKGKDADEAQVSKAVAAWADAWSDKRVSAYLASYSRSFKADGLSRSEWEKQRRQRIEAAKKISVKVGKLRIKIDGKKATARFVQQYSSDKTDKSTVKTLILEKNGDRWLISEERVG